MRALPPPTSAPAPALDAACPGCAAPFSFKREPASRFSAPFPLHAQRLTRVRWQAATGVGGDGVCATRAAFARAVPSIRARKSRRHPRGAAIRRRLWIRPVRATTTNRLAHRPVPARERPPWVQSPAQRGRAAPHHAQSRPGADSVALARRVTGQRRRRPAAGAPQRPWRPPGLVCRRARC